MSQAIAESPSLNTLLQNQDTTLAAVQDLLNSLDFDARLDACMKLNKTAQRNLYNLCADNPCSLQDLVPAGTPPKTEVILEGKNTLPLFTRFQKRFCVPDTDDDVLYGYNEGGTRWLIGPGYFVAHATDAPQAGDGWTGNAASVVNYSMVPPSDDAVVDSWPKVKPNHKGLQFFVYRGMNDFMRKVTDDVSIGSAYRGDKNIDSYFVLVRRPA